MYNLYNEYAKFVVKYCNLNIAYQLIRRANTVGKNMNGNKKNVRVRYSFYNMMLIILIGVLFIAIYTTVLQKMYNDSILDNEIAVNSSRTDAMHKGVSDMLTREDFTEINTKADMEPNVIVHCSLISII